ncbi:hypothetical protein BKA59DRAFT_246413 [Fusarium tricinctum]|jgi:hypothetical protein|uniref:Uncharacterized protein n=1 Tax=Fusarium tricinctum TaxID=61284 RepID=A0A8K0W9E6_9HYPO|nr:hypothetical protein BKA59DRAFT_246413 [Fusarium tricinctum]
MDSSAEQPASHIENTPRRDKRATFATDEIMLLSPNEANNTYKSQSLSLCRNTTEPRKAGRHFSGLASIRRKNDNFWKTLHAYSKKLENMCLLAVIGTLFSVGHQLFYLNLNGKEATHQSRMLRYGTIITFCAKASLGTAVAMAFHQRAWQVVRHKTARLETVDSIFTANTDISSLLTWGSIKKAKIGTLLAT